MLFLLNPAVLLVNSVWGTTHSISVVFLLLSIWMSEKERPTLAWILLGMGAMTRPQLLVPAFLLGIAYLRKFRRPETKRSVPVGIIMAFILIIPFTLAFSPSFPLDVFRTLVRIQNVEDPQLAAYYFTSHGTLNIWPLIAWIDLGLEGARRFYVPVNHEILGVTYVQLGNILSLGVLVLITVFLLLRKREHLPRGAYLLPVALGTLGVLLFRTGVSNHHFILVLPFLILCKPLLSDTVYYATIAIVSITTFVSVYGDFGIGTLELAELVPAIHYNNNIVTRFFVDLHRSDLFITLGSLANLFIIPLLASGLWSYRKNKHTG